MDNNNMYDNESPRLIDILLDPNSTEPIVLMDENGRQVEFEQVAIIPQVVDGQKTLFVILKPLDKIEGIADDEAIVFRMHFEEDDEDVKLKAETREEIANAVFDEYYKMLEEKRQREGK
ncbi:MAG: DUF1292 domain-containing protein [Clostridiales bacterium]|nr:DUF1292 domain-containing protein [Clostridiales bacterium]